MQNFSFLGGQEVGEKTFSGRLTGRLAGRLAKPDNNANLSPAWISLAWAELGNNNLMLGLLPKYNEFWAHSKWLEKDKTPIIDVHQAESGKSGYEKQEKVKLSCVVGKCWKHKYYSLDFRKNFPSVRTLCCAY